MKNIITLLFIIVISLSGIELKAQIPPPPPSFYDYVRALSELNIKGVGSAFPYISSDGLNIYFTQGVAPNFNLYTASRTDLKSLFKNKKIVSNSLPSKIMGIWLTDNQLDLYYTDSTNIFYSSRASTSSEFISATKIKLGKALTGYILCPSLSPDQSELFVSNQSTKNSILRFNRVASDSFSFSDTMTLGLKYPAFPGQLSKDGYDWIGQFLVNDTFKICSITRASLNDKFNISTFQAFEGKFSKYLRNMQPSISDDQNTMIIARTETGLWNDNNLFLVATYDITTGINEPLPSEKLTDIKVFPNPVNSLLTIDYSGYSGSEKPTLELYDITGALITSLPIYSSLTQVNISDLTDGVYIVKVTNDKTVVVKRIIKK